MQSQQLLHRFPELERSDLNLDRVQVETLDKSPGMSFAADIADFDRWTLYKASASIEDDEVFVACTCDLFQEGGISRCRHICELLDYLQWSNFAWPQAKMRLRRDEERPAWRRTLGIVRQLSGDAVPSQAEVEPPVELSIVLDVPFSVQRNRLCIAMFQSPRGRNGRRLRPRPALPADLCREPWLAARGRETIDLMEALECAENMACDGVEIELNTALQRLLLPQLPSLGKLFWTLDRPSELDSWKPLTWRPEPWTANVEVEPNDDGWRFHSRLQSGDEQRSPSEAVLLLESGAVVFEQDLGVMERPQAAFPWLAALQQGGPFVVPAADTPQLLTRLYEDPVALEGISLPDELEYESEVGTPEPRAQIGKPPNGSRRLPLSVDFVYRGQVASARIGAVDHEQQRLTLRDHEAEEAHLQTLLNAGVERRQGFSLAPSQLPATVALLSAAGWQVEADGKRVRNSKAVHVAVQSGLDWFDLEGTFDFDGAEVSIPRVLSAMRRGDKFVKLDDGSHGLLPEEWLSKFATVAQLGEADGDTIRFTMPQAAILDAMLDAQDSVAMDAKFAKYRQQLASFEGVRPAQPPRAFRGQLRPYQEQGLGWMKFLREFGLGGCLADDMGLGKTVQVLAMLQAERSRRLKKGERRLPSLIVVPRSLLFNWAEEAAKFTPRLRVLQYFGSDREPLQETFCDHDVIITTYGIIRRDIEVLVEHCFHYVVLDEAQAIKNNSSQASKACRLLEARHRLALTGTPVENHLGELWSLFEFLNPGLLGRNDTFLSLARRASQDPEARELIAGGIRPFVLRRTKEGVLKDLPPKTEHTIICEMPPQQRELYDELRDYYRQLLNQKMEQQGLNRSKIHVLEALLRLRQCACHPQLIDSSIDAASAKFQTLLEHIESLVEEGHKALVFSQFTKLLALVRTQLDERGLRYEYLDGRTRKRQERVHAFQNDPECPLFLISLKAGGHGLNLTAADYVFILDPWWNPAVEAQAVDRVHRIGQDKPIFAYRLICKDTVEEKIVELQKEKRSLAESIIRADASLMQTLTAEDLAVLLS